jgi:hypothetical protein
MRKFSSSLLALALVQGCGGASLPQRSASITGAKEAPAGFQAPAAPYQIDPARLESLLAMAREKKLHEDPVWRRLVHYRPGVFWGVESQVDGPAFFLSPSGVSDPSAELEATIRGFYSPESAGKEHALCRFPARWLWLRRRLDVSGDALPPVNCPGLAGYLKRADARSITVVFSSYYLNNPASMFGHTFLRFNRGAGGTEEGRTLLEQGIDYSAAVPEKENQLVYSFKGLTGMYPGIFRMLPYYYKVREYNDFESRDLWEYDLALSEEEVAMVVAHIWEMGHSYFDYYYLSENCSYHVLAALEVANPRLNLLDNLGWPVIPADTVKAMMSAPGLVSRVNFRPSATSTFRARLKTLPGKLVPWVARLGADPGLTLPASFTPEEAAQVVDGAIDYVEMVHAKDILADERSSPGATLKQKLLERRAEMEADTPDLVVTPPEDEMPHRGHGSSRFGVGAGLMDPARGGRPASSFFQLDYRLALHDLSDAPAGYPEFSQLEFLPMRIRFSPEQQRIRVEDLSLVRVISLNPVDRFNLRPSYKVRVGAVTFRDDRCAECTLGALELGGGLATATAGRAVTLWATLDAGFYAVRFGGDSPDRVRLQVGPSAGVRLRILPRLLSVTSGGWSVLPFHDRPRSVWEATTVLRWHPTGSWAATLEGRLQPQSTQIMLGNSIYF